MTDTTRRSLIAAAAMTMAGAAALSDVDAQPRQGSRDEPGPGAGRAAIVTGSSRGIGAAVARRLARQGYAVTVNCFKNDALAAKVVDEIEAAGGRAIWLRADVADPAAVRALFDANDRAFGGVDVVVSNAGIMNVGLFATMTDEAFDRMIATNIKGGFNVLREAARRTRSGGRIISMGSSITSARRPPGTGAYAATKSAQDMYSAVLAKELAGRNISVNAVAPGAVDTELVRQNQTEDMLRGFAAQTPYRRLGKPQDVADVVAMLCSADGMWINGQVLYANGGLA